jgi:hypothetical protein
MCIAENCNLTAVLNSKKCTLHKSICNVNNCTKKVYHRCLKCYIHAKKFICLKCNKSLLKTEKAKDNNYCLRCVKRYNLINVIEFDTFKDETNNVNNIEFNTFKNEMDTYQYEIVNINDIEFDPFNVTEFKSFNTNDIDFEIFYNIYNNINLISNALIC